MSKFIQNKDTIKNLSFKYRKSNKKANKFVNVSDNTSNLIKSVMENMQLISKS